MSGTIETNNTFSVCQFFNNGTHEYVRRYVSAEEAVKAVEHYTKNVAVKMGLIEKVIITDGLDCTVFEWTPRGGVIWAKVCQQDVVQQ